MLFSSVRIATSPAGVLDKHSQILGMRSRSAIGVQRKLMRSAGIAIPCRGFCEVQADLFVEPQVFVAFFTLSQNKVFFEFAGFLKIAIGVGQYVVQPLFVDFGNAT